MPLAGDPSCWSDDLAFAHELAAVAGEIALGFFGSTGSHIKSDGTPVGEADIAIDALLSAQIRSTHPEDGILSEESTEAPGSSSRRWIIDPVDGTVPFLAGLPDWGTHVALEVNGTVELGVVTRPVLGEVWWAQRGAGAWNRAGDEGPTRLAVSDVAELSKSRVTTWPFLDGVEATLLRSAAVWAEPDMRSLLRLLQGRMEVVLCLAGGPWDHAPATVLVEEAGGVFTDPAGGRRLDAGGARYTNGHVEAALDALLAPV